LQAAGAVLARGGRQLNSVSAHNPAALNYAAQSPSLAMQLLLQAGANFIHAEAGLAWTGYLQQRFANQYALALAELIDGEADGSDVLFDLARMQIKSLERLGVHQENLAGAARTRVAAAGQSGIPQGRGAFDFAHGLVRPGTQKKMRHLAHQSPATLARSAEAMSVR
jgi:hypothetical protein